MRVKNRKKSTRDEKKADLKKQNYQQYYHYYFNLLNCITMRININFTLIINNN